jgi:DHA1 family tetracycline resistance protein-like MFS transporter
VFIDLVGFGIVIPILPLYAEMFGPSPMVFGLLMASYSAMQFVSSPILGRLSDHFGRKPVLLVSLVGTAVGYVMFAFAGSLAVLFASRILDGISGGNISTAQAVIADITDEKDRAKGMGIIGAAFGLGFILGPGIAALLVDIAPWLPGMAAAVTSMVAFLLVLFVLPETLDESTRTKARRHPFTIGSLRQALGAHPLVGLCFAIVLLVIFAFSNFETTFAQFATSRLALGMSQIGWVFVFAGVLGAVVQGGLVGRLAVRFGEARLMVVGAVLACLGAGAVPYTSSLVSLLPVLAVLALGQGLVSPSLSSLTSKLVHPDEVGGVMGVYQSFSSLGRILGPFWAEWVYGHVDFHWPFRTAALAYVAAFIVAVALLVRLRHDPTSENVPAM